MGLGGGLGTGGILLAFYMCLPPPLLFRAVPFIWGRRDVMFCCFCKRGASEESPLCTGLRCEHCQKGEGHFFIWHLFPTCSIGWEIHSKNKRQLWPPFLSFFFFIQRAISIWELYLFLRPFDLLLHSRSKAVVQLIVCHKIGPPINVFMLYTRFAW